MGEPVVDGWTADGFEGARDAFARNLATGADVGAAFTAYHRGEPVVDLWGGLADRETGRPWAEDTLALVFSTTKGMTATCAHRLIQAGALDVEAPVADYWPEFAAAGKDDVTVAHLLSHQAGLAWVDDDMELAEVLAWEPVIEALADQEPHWEPGSAHGYHATTYGWLVGEVVRRVADERVGAYFAREVAEPLGLDCRIGTPAEHHDRVATLVSMLPEGVDMEALADPGDDPVLGMIAQFLGPDTPLGRALYAPGGALADQEVWGLPELYEAEVPAANGITDARSVARMYAALVGEVDGIRLLEPAQLEAAITQRTEGPNRVLLDMDIQFGLGFMVRSTLIPLGGERGFGHFGAGGSVGWADPDADLAFGYVMNKMDLGLAGDVRSTSLINACYAAID